MLVVLLIFCCFINRVTEEGWKGVWGQDELCTALVHYVCKEGAKTAPLYTMPSKSVAPDHKE